MTLASRGTDGPLSRLPTLWFTAALAVAVALVPRLVVLAGSDFPLNDGGLFAVMIREIIGVGFRLPFATAYNGAGIPFAYPPLALYVAAALVKLTGCAIPALLRWLPLLANMGTVVAFCALARSLVSNRWSAFAAALLFPTLPYSIEWLLTGGGLTRSFGVLSVTVAALAAHRYLVTRRAGVLVPTILFAACAALTHPEAGASVVVTYALFWLLLGRDRAAIRAGVVVAVGVAALSAPWWLTVIVRHGVGTLLAAGGTADWSWAQLLPLPAFAISGETMFTPIAVLALLGFVFDLARGRTLIPCWLVVSYLVPKLGSREVILPLALLAGEAAGDIVFPALRKAFSDRERPAGPGRGVPQAQDTSKPRGGRLPDLAPALLLAFLVCYGMLGNAFRLSPSGHPIPALTPGERAAMAWVAANTPIRSRFVVVTSSSSWAEDPTSEWFPALADRVSVATPQGREWIPGDSYRRACQGYDALKRCGAADLACLERWAREEASPWTHIFISKVVRGEFVPQALLTSIAASRECVLVYNGPGAFIFARTDGPSHR
jgi:hypothetical protein